MKHTEKTKSEMSKRTKKWMASLGTKKKSEMLLKGLKTKEKNGTLHKERKTTWKAGWREIGNVKKYYRSRWEANYARYLEWLKSNGRIKKWEHEPETFWFEKIKRGTRSYLPDFRVEENNGNISYHEVKGWMDKRSITKLKRMKKYYPETTVVLIRKKEYDKIKSIVDKIIIGWE